MPFPFSRRLFIALALPFTAALLACPSDDDLTSPFAPMNLVIKVSPPQVTITISDTVTASANTQLLLSATSLGFPVVPPHAQWTTSNPNVATSTSVVTVTNQVTGLTLLPTTASGAVGDSVVLTATAVGANGQLVGGTAYLFSVADPSVARLTRTGNQTVSLNLLKAGSTQVSVAAGGRVASSAITVH